ncbi:MAG: hypothetical protein OCU22_07810 [Canidatus Methanoxibalbensis ujae]|nr:hypothetical protein [Candidatus Methanoxibalbensis ujae]
MKHIIILTEGVTRHSIPAELISSISSDLNVTAMRIITLVRFSDNISSYELSSITDYSLITETIRRFIMDRRPLSPIEATRAAAEYIRTYIEDNFYSITSTLSSQIFSRYYESKLSTDTEISVFDINQFLLSRATSDIQTIIIRETSR